jgi:putative oxidoreductase
MPLELPESVATIALVIGRVLLGGVFVRGGLSHFPALTPMSEAMRARGVPFPRTMLVLGTLWQIAFGALLMLGIFTAIASLALALFLILATVMMLNFWDHPAGADREALFRGFSGNVAILGGLLIAAAA